MPAALNASTIPTAWSVLAPINPADVAATGSSTRPRLAPSIESGQPDWPRKCNTEAAMMEALGAAIGPGIVSGLVLSATGLALSLSDGVAIIGGVVGVRSAAPPTLPPSTSRVWIYLSSAGVVSFTAPGGPYILLGSCQTGVSGVTGSFDSSGVLYVRSGLVWRETGDSGAPGDTLGSGVRVWTKTAGGVYLWDGSAHVKLSP